MLAEPSATVYDELPYPGAVQNWTHPDQMATKALLAGMQPPSVEKCRVLELGCGGGTNLTTMAFGLPHSRLLGVDLAKKHLEGATALATKLGLENVEFRCADVLDLGPDLGEFDYIVVPGLYSWVPADVRDKLLALCGACLAPNGVAVLSYNAYPGCYPSTMARDMMEFHVRSLDGPAKQIRQARGLINLLIECQHENTTYKADLQRELNRMALQADGVFYHDDLNPHYHPVFFHQFAAHATQHGLQYLGERCESVLDPDNFPEQIRPALKQLGKCGVIEREQYLDFIYARRFRCTFLCRQDVALPPEDQRPGIANLRVSLSRHSNVVTKIDAESGISFMNDSGTLATTKLPLLVAAVSHLLHTQPQSIPFPELLAAARAGRNAETSVTDTIERDAAMLENFILKCYVTQFLSLGTWSPHCVDQPSERPVANAMARALVGTVRSVPSVYHEPVEIRDELGQRLLGLLDGSRDRSTLLTELNRVVETGNVTLPEGTTAVTLEMLGQNLQTFARLGLLTN